jgi:hypothetical protein
MLECLGSMSAFLEVRVARNEPKYWGTSVSYIMLVAITSSIQVQVIAKRQSKLSTITQQTNTLFLNMSDKELLKLALDTQAARDNDPELTDNLCLEIKQSAIFNFNWQDLLQSAPIAISATGACYAACFSTDGARIQLEPPLQGAFKHLG